MRDIKSLTSFEIRTIIEQYWAGENLPALADAFGIDRIQLFNLKNENREMWEGIEQNIILSEIRSLIREDAREELSDCDAARVNLCFFLLRFFVSRSRPVFPYRDFLVDHALRVKNYEQYGEYSFSEHLEIQVLEDAKDAVATFENDFGIVLLESPLVRGRTEYHV